jgi:acetyl esterase/lipase
LQPPPVGDLEAVSRWRTTIHAQWLDGDPSAEACGHHPTEVAGVRCLRAGVDEADQGRPLVVYCHGGGYALGSPEVALPITERLAAGAEVVSVDYRLAPEHPYPAAIDDVHAVYRAVSAAATKRPIWLVGDSAGANLALATAIRQRDEGGHRPRGLALLSPHLDHARSGAERHPEPSTTREDVDGTAATWLREAYCADVAPNDWRVSPLRAALDHLPPTLIQVGSNDSSLGDAIRFSRRARTAGMEVTLDVWHGLWHTWHYHRDLPEADAAMGEIASLLAASRP